MTTMNLSVISTALLVFSMSGAVAGLAYRRGGRPGAWMALAVVGYCVLWYLGWEAGRLDLGEFVGFCWLLALNPLAYLMSAGFRRAPGHWQCPDCRCFNVPSTLVCDCGYRLDEEPSVFL